jgi:predicted dehydrogenase
MKPPVRLALIGHKFMGKAHSQALHDLPFFFDLPVEPVRAVLCGLGNDLAPTAARYGWQAHTSDWKAVVNDPSINAVSIATPGNTHCEIAVAAANAGKHVLCEKPLALTGAEARRMYDAVEQAKVRHVVNFNYRRVPAVRLARKLISGGQLGDILYFRATYWQDWPLDPGFPFVWRFDKSAAGAGSMADKGSHIVDLARYLAGEIDEVASITTIYVKQRFDGPLPRPVTTDDAAAFITRFRNGALGLFGTSRMSAGHKNGLSFEVNGSRGSLMFDLERLNELQVYFAGDAADVQGFRTISATGPQHDYIAAWWPPGHVLGWEHTFIHQYYEFLKAIASAAPTEPSFYDGLRTQQVLDAVETAAAEKRWIPVEGE